METLDIVYIFTNEGMPGLCKIGYTTRNDVKERAKELYTTGVPYPFQIYYACQVINGKNIEKILHKLFDEFRVNHNREFFEIDPEKVILALQLTNPVDVTPKENEYLTVDEIKEIKNTEKKRLSNFTFQQANIPIGSVLHFCRNSDITCTVFSDNTVMFNGEIMTLTEAARNTGLIPYYELQGPKFWLYEDELLTKRRIRIQDLC
jgi:hypothetical protein